MAMDYRKAFETLFESLKDNPRIAISNIQLQPGLSAIELAEISDKHKVVIPTPLAKFYQQLNGAHLEWEVRREVDIEPLTHVMPDALWGSFRIHGLDTLLTGSAEYPLWEGLLWFDKPELGPQIQLKKLRPFDLYAEDDSECACFFVNEGRLTTTIFLHSIEDGIRPLSIDLESYIQMLIAAKGFYGWQSAHVDPDSRAFDRLHHFLPQLFPDADLSLFQKL